MIDSSVLCGQFEGSPKVAGERGTDLGAAHVPLILLRPSYEERWFPLEHPERKAESEFLPNLYRGI